MYKVILHPKVQKVLKRVSKGDKTIFKKLAFEIKSLYKNPRPNNRIQIRFNLNRIRVGQYRIIYRIFDNDKVVIITKVARRSEDTYNDLHSLKRQADRLLKSIKNE